MDHTAMHRTKFTQRNAASTVECHPRLQDEASTQKTFIGPVYMINRRANVEIVIAVGGSGIQNTGIQIAIIYGYTLVGKHLRSHASKTEGGQLVLEISLRDIQHLRGKRALESNGELMISVFIQSLMVGRGDGIMTVVEDAVGRTVIQGQESDTPSVIFRKQLLQQGKIDGSSSCFVGIVDRRPLIPIVSGHPEVPVKQPGHRRIQGKRGSEKLGEMRVLPIQG